MSGPILQRQSTAFGMLEVVTSNLTTHHFPRHFHENFPFGVVERGVLGFNYRGAKLAAWQGTINLANPGEVHDGYPLAGGGWQYRMFYVDCRFVRAAMDMNSEAEFPWFPGGVIRDAALAKKIARVHRQIQSGVLSPFAVESELFLLLQEMIARHSYRPAPQISRQRHPAALQSACDLMHDCPNQALSQQTLADACGFSPGYFVRAFREQYGMTPHQYRLLCRIQYARQQIIKGMPLSDIALQTGFTDQSHFSRVFKQFYGYPPGYLTR